MNVILGDSRASSLNKARLKIKLKEVEDIWGKPGGGYSCCTQLVLDNIIYHHPPLNNDKCHFYILAGICDLTHKISGKGYQEVIFNDANGSLGQTIKSKINHLEQCVLREGAIPVFCTIIPMHLATWNHHRLSHSKTKMLNHLDKYEAMQANMEEVLHDLNRFIVETNNSNGMATPTIHTAITRRRHGKTYTLYKNLPDGCHPDVATLQKIATSINKAIVLNQKRH